MNIKRLTGFQEELDRAHIQKAAGSAQVMVVENDLTTLMLISEILKNLGFNIIEAYNGKEAINLLALHQPLFIFMDADMPEMDGCEATRYIRSLPNPVSTIPVIGLIADAQADSEKCLAAGMNDYISKPFRLEQIISKLKILLVA